MSIHQVAVASVVFALIAGCESKPKAEIIVPPEATTVKYPGYTRPHVAIEDADWTRSANAATPQRGKIPRGDYVLFSRQTDGPVPASVEAVYSPVGVVQVRPEQFKSASFTHRLKADTAWYQNPAQSRVETGILLKGTEVAIIRDAGSYSEVYTANGVRGFVPSDSLVPR